MSEQIEVLITVPFPDKLINSLIALSPRLKIHLVAAQKPAEISPDLWKRIEVLYTARILPAPDQAPRLRWIQFHMAGLDHVINAPIVSKPEVKVTTASGTMASQVAEYILTMLLGLGHHFPELISLQRRAEWPRDRWERFGPRELRGSIVGIVGYGSIGRQVARLLQPFGAEVLATKQDAMHPEDPGYISDGLGDPQGEMVHRLYPAQALRSMIKLSDFVVVCVPLTPETRNLIGPQELAAFKPEAYLVDVSRGGIVDQTALLAALKERRLAGAALDVFPEEPLPEDSPLWKAPNLVLTPHISGISTKFDERVLQLFLENLRRYLAGQSLLNVFDPERGY
jgi:phosphoglycerate dehydrogenase-like enzyme